MKKILLTVGLMFGATGVLSAQTSQAMPSPTPTASPMEQVMQNPAPASLDTILTEGEKQAANYREAFKNLIATETKRVENYNGNGDAKDAKIVEANFLVYQSSKDAKVSSELRNVTKVDGNPIPDSQAKSDKFFEELGKEKTLESELKKIEKESTRYDKDIEATGLTLYEGIILANNIRPYFDFKLEGTENVQGRNAYVVSYLQTKASPYITLNAKESNSNQPNLDYGFSLPGDLKKADAFLRGKFWFDAQTYQILREERDLLVRTNDPLVLMQSTFDYQPSEYEIMVPKQISVTTNDVRKKDGKFTALKGSKVTFDYSKFRKSNVEVIILDDDQ